MNGWNCTAIEIKVYRVSSFCSTRYGYLESFFRIFYSPTRRASARAMVYLKSLQQTNQAQCLRRSECHSDCSSQFSFLCGVSFWKNQVFEKADAFSQVQMYTNSMKSKPLIPTGFSAICLSSQLPKGHYFVLNVSITESGSLIGLLSLFSVT